MVGLRPNRSDNLPPKGSITRKTAIASVFARKALFNEMPSAVWA